MESVVSSAGILDININLSLTGSLSPAHLPRLTPLHVPDVQSESVAVTAPGNVGVDVNISSVTIFRSAEHPSQCRAGAS